MTKEEKRDVFSRQQVTLDRMAILNTLANLKDQLNKLEEKLGNALWKFWFFNNDEKKICWRKETKK